MIHETKICDYNGSLRKLAEAIGNLRYDSLQEFLSCLSKKLEKDSKADMGRKRTLLALNLLMASGDAGRCAKAISEAWKISEPFMRTPE